MEDMMKGKVPTVFLSSTCYDLRQIRTDLKDFFEKDLGFDILVSEFNSFPVIPNTNTIDSCTQAVKEYADVLILIVGGRYGYITETGKSITNLEYITAKEKHIPIYVFIDKSVMNMINLWKDNPNMDFNSVVDSTKVFEFIDTLRNKENIWVYGFEHAQDIISTLRKQLAHLFLKMLKLKNQVDNANITTYLQSLKGESLRLLIEQPFAWEHKIFGQICEDGIRKLEDLKRDYKYGISLEKSRKLTDFEEILKWIEEKNNDFIIMMDNISDLVNVRLPEALNEVGMPADIEYVVYVARKIIDLYEKALKIGIEVKFIVVDEEFKGLLEYLIDSCDIVLKALENFCNDYQEKIKNLKEGDKGTIQIELTIEAPNLEKFYTSLDKIQKTQIALHS